ncbi:MAG: alpha/beta hydrolase, partial [Ardenticatenales bacterium]
MITPRRLAVTPPVALLVAFAALVACAAASSAPIAVAATPVEGAVRAARTLSAALAPTAAFAPVDCAEFGYAWEIAPDEAVCGDVTVPLHHADPRGPTITLAVAVVHRSAGASDGAGGAATSSIANARDAAPLILLQGGPGASTIDAFFDLALAAPTDRSGLAGIREQRDLVLLDQRGTRYGQPALMCPELVDLTRKTIELDLDPDVYFALEDDAVADCRDALDGQGIDIAAFNSLENAADIPSVAQALGYDRFSVYGVSYGSLLALHLMRQQPPGLESVVLDGVVPPPIDFNQEAPASLNGSLSALFDACAAAPDCKAAYPNLEATLRDTLDRLDDHPARVPVIDPATGIRYRALVDGRSLLDAVHQLLYGGPDLPIVPRMIDAAARGNDGALGEIMGSYAFDDSLAEGMYMSTVCSEDGDINPDAVPLDRIRPWLADRLSGDADDILAGCDIWDVPALPAPIDAPVVSDVPTLLMSGRFDPITPPAFAEATARTLSHAQRVVFPAGGHGALGDPCSNALVAAFLADPTAKLDTACAADPAAPDFRTPADTFFSPVPRTMLRLFDLLVPVGDEPPEA